MIRPGPPRQWEQSANGLYIPAWSRPSPQPSSSIGTSPEPNPGTRAEDSAAGVAPYLLGAVPVLFPLVAIGLLGDSAVLRVVLWQGNIAALFVAMLQEFLPIVAGSAVFLTTYRVMGRARARTAICSGLAVAGSLLAFTSANIAIVQAGVLGALALVTWPRSRRVLGPRHVLASVLTVATAIVGGGVWVAAQDRPSDAVWQLLRSRALNGLPREVAVRQDGEVIIWYLVSSDERITTGITGFPNTVAAVSVASDDVAVRLPCRPREEGASRSVADMVLPSRQRGGTAFCGDLADCLLSLPATARIDNASVRGCAWRASGAPNTATAEAG